MTKKRVEWKVTLNKSNYQQTSDEMIPKVVLRDTLTLDDLLNRISAHSSCALNPETLRHAAGLLMDAIEDHLVEGYAISTPVGTLAPAVTGTWHANRLLPEARALNKATVRYTPGAHLKRVLADPLFHVIGVGARWRVSIYNIQDTATRTENERLTPGRTFIVNGIMLLMNGDLPERGIYLLNSETGETVRHLPPEEFVLCTRRRILATVPPDLPEGEYLVRVVSQCTTNPRPMKQAAEYTFETPLRVEGGMI